MSVLIDNGWFWVGLIKHIKIIWVLYVLFIFSFCQTTLKNDVKMMPKKEAEHFQQNNGGPGPMARGGYRGGAGITLV